MADIKTHLRELSVAVVIGCLKNKIPFLSALTPVGFMEIANEMPPFYSPEIMLVNLI